MYQNSQHTSSVVPASRSHLSLLLLLTVSNHGLAVTIRLHQVLPSAVVEGENCLVFARIVLTLLLQAARVSWACDKKD